MGGNGTDVTRIIDLPYKYPVVSMSRKNPSTSLRFARTCFYNVTFSTMMCVDAAYLWRKRQTMRTNMDKWTPVTVEEAEAGIEPRWNSMLKQEVPAKLMQYAKKFKSNTIRRY
eukprot:scaffold84758_cov61-Attheya_sp.AAC.4